MELDATSVRVNAVLKELEESQSAVRDKASVEASLKEEGERLRGRVEELEGLCCVLFRLLYRGRGCLVVGEGLRCALFRLLFRGRGCLVVGRSVFSPFVRSSLIVRSYRSCGRSCWCGTVVPSILAGEIVRLRAFVVCTS